LGFGSQRDHEREKAKPPKGLFLFEDENKAVQFALVFGRRKKKKGARSAPGLLSL
jgi:hypothetical protein